MVPSTRNSCLNYAGSYLYNYFGNREILFYISYSYIYIFCHIFVISGLGYYL